MTPAYTTYGHCVAATLCHARRAQGVSRDAVAVSVGMSGSGWSRVETGVTTPTSEHIARAAEALGLVPGHLVAQADELVKELRQRGIQVVGRHDVPEGVRFFAAPALLPWCSP